MATLETPARPARAARAARVSDRRIPAALTWTAGWWLAGRALVAATALVVHRVGPSGYIPQLERAHALGVLEAWDGRWYRIVASSGYLLVPGRQSDPAFFPLYPMLLRGGHALGLGYATTGLLVANLAFPVALFGLYLLTNEIFGERLARRATAYLAVFPLGFVFSMMYPESLVLALIVFAALAAYRDRWLATGLCAAVAGLARPEAIFLSLPLLALAWRRRRMLGPVDRGLAFAAAAAAPAAVLSYVLYLWHALGEPFAWQTAQRAWGRHFSSLGAIWTIRDLGEDMTRNAWVLREVAAAVLYLVLVAVAIRAGAPLAWTLGAGAIVVLPLFSGAFDSIGRFGLLAPAIVWGLAVLGRRAWCDRVIVALSSALLVASTATIPLMYP